MKPIRILHVLGGLDLGGAESFVMNLYREIDKNLVQFDFVKHVQKKGAFEYEIIANDGRIFKCPNYTGKNHFSYCKWWNEFFKEHREYDIIHSHVRSTASIYLKIAKKYGLKTIIHSHSTSNGSGFKSIVKKCLQYPLRYQADYLFACSNIAGEWLYGKKACQQDNFYILNNAIDVEKYKINQDTRKRIRKELKVENNFVFGHVGRLHEAKNHKFLLEVFQDLLKKKPESKLILVGDGELRNEIEEKIKALNIQDAVIMTGSRNDVPDLLMSFDAFLFPSRWEGLPVTVVEAQAASLPCFVSDTVTKEVGISNLVHYLPINKGAEYWCNAIMNSDLSKKDVCNEIIAAGFDVKETAKWLTDFYMRIANE